MATSSHTFSAPTWMGLQGPTTQWLGSSNELYLSRFSVRQLEAVKFPYEKMQILPLSNDFNANITDENQDLFLHMQILKHNYHQDALFSKSSTKPPMG